MIAQISQIYRRCADCTDYTDDFESCYHGMTFLCLRLKITQIVEEGDDAIVVQIV
jgi:hypothetical protein